MAQADFWSQGRVLIAGDSRVRRLKEAPDHILATNVDYAFEGGILIDDLISLVDRKLTEHHKVIILIGLVGDEVQRYIHHIDDDTPVTLIRSKDSEGIDKVLISMHAAQVKWLELKAERIILWALPYYIDYLGYNSARIGEFEMGEALDISLQSSKSFVNYVSRLQRQILTTIPDVFFCLLNRALFDGRKNNHLYRSFGAVSAKDYMFPPLCLSDGLHPSVAFAKKIWSFLHKSICNVHDRLSGKEKVSAPSGSGVVSLPKPKLNFKGKAERGGKRHPAKKPYSYKKINLYPQEAAVHSRLYHPQDGDTVEELLEEEPVAEYSNLSWVSPNYRPPQRLPTRAPLPTYHQGTSKWSWEYHRQVIADTKTAVYTQGLKEHVEAKGRLATIIRERGLALASQGEIVTVNEAANRYMAKLHSEINAPHEKAKLILEDVSKLLPVEESSESSEDEN